MWFCWWSRLRNNFCRQTNKRNNTNSRRARNEAPSRQASELVLANFFSTSTLAAAPVVARHTQQVSPRPSRRSFTRSQLITSTTRLVAQHCQHNLANNSSTCYATATPNSPRPSEVKEEYKLNKSVAKEHSSGQLSAKSMRQIYHRPLLCTLCRVVLSRHKALR